MYDSKAYCNESRKPYYKMRKRPTIRCGCRAHLQLKYVDSVIFEVHDFVEGHNHSMVADSNIQFVHSARKLTHVQEEAIYELSNLNLGPIKAFNFMRTQYGGFEKVGATKDDCMNFKQGLNCYIGEYDAEMIQKLCAKKTFSYDYSFEYDVNDNRELVRVFWADEISKSNYLAFGDIISFDVTFKTNKYKMVFVLFTTIDNHCPSVTKVVVNDQDPTMKQAIASVFPNTRHRLYIWHIMKKVADKAIMVEFELDKNKWLSDMYEIRFDWIPAFHRDEPLSELMRTTSRSIHRYNGRWCDHDSRYTYPQLETRSYLEREAVRIYTRSIFNDVQDEMNQIVGGVSQFSSCEEEGGYLRCKIWDFNAYVPGFLEVVIKKYGEFGEESIATCSSKKFEQYGLLCRHIFYVMNMYQVKKFPKIYIKDRWRKEVAVNIRTVPMSEFGNNQNRKIKEISREIKYAGEYLINSYVADINELIKIRDEMNLIIER
ncbi:protein FAR1-RELATED SEQUENCE 5-like [Bidens hawaiensis]|uniref:protein FAR1-RELATED SEQUENCE 5-like n=1 Tax=Bidens hawaiensis TaxID=980011 RepID=UPI00404A00EF